MDSSSNFGLENISPKIFNLIFLSLNKFEQVAQFLFAKTMKKSYALKRTYITTFDGKQDRRHAIRNTGVLGVTSIPGFWGKMTDFQEKLGQNGKFTKKNWGKMKNFDKN